MSNFQYLNLGWPPLWGLFKELSLYPQSLGGGVAQHHMHYNFCDEMRSHSATFLHGRRLGCTFNASWRAPSMIRLWTNCLYNVSLYILYYMPVLSSYVRDHVTLPRISANADSCTPLKCLTSGKKSIKPLRPSTPRQTSALELLVSYCFHILPPLAPYPRDIAWVDTHSPQPQPLA